MPEIYLPLCVIKNILLYAGLETSCKLKKIDKDVTQMRKHCQSIMLMLMFAAEDRVGHVTEMSSSRVIIDNTPPVIAYLAAGTVTQGNFIPGHELTVGWMGMEDKESGVESIQVAPFLHSFVLFLYLFFLVFFCTSPAVCSSNNCN